MNKSSLIAAVAQKTGLSKKDADAAVIAVLDVISESLKANDKVQIMGFGSFEVRERPERPGVNPQTKEKIMLAASKTPVFKPGKALKDFIA